MWRIIGGTKRWAFVCVECGDLPRGGAWFGAKRAGTELQVDLRDAVMWTNRIRSEWHEHRYARRDENKSEWFTWYDKYLASLAWKEIRAKVLMRDEYKCLACGSPATQVHHLTYERVGYEHIDDLASVCVDCHQYVHGRGL
jgi:5-methylcytosine-specific restriction endonuclease McrA